MFTGLVQGLGRIMRAEKSAEGIRMTVATPLASDLASGDSVAVSGVCLTAVEVSAGSFVAEVMNETVARTSLGTAEPDSDVNLELPLLASDRLGGHLVQGHVDGIGSVTGIEDDGFARRLRIDAPEGVLQYLVQKGSVAVDGVSLTVAEVEERSFTVSLIPETLQRTNLGKIQPGARVNLEVDVLAKYVEKLIAR